MAKQEKNTIFLDELAFSPIGLNIFASTLVSSLGYNMNQILFFCTCTRIIVLELLYNCTRIICNIHVTFIYLFICHFKYK